MDKTTYYETFDVDPTASDDEKLAEYLDDLNDTYTPRQLRLVRNCIEYANGDPAGLPGHQLMLLVAEVASWQMDTEAIAMALRRVE